MKKIADHQRHLSKDSRDTAAFKPDTPFMCLIALCVKFVYFFFQTFKILRPRSTTGSLTVSDRSRIFVCPAAGEQSLRDRLFVHIVLDTVHDHAVHVPRDIQRGEPAREADPREDELRPPDELRAGDGREPAAIQRRGQRVVVPDHAGAQRSPFDAVPGQQELHQDEARAQGGQDAGHHHGHVYRLLAAFFPVVSAALSFFFLSQISILNKNSKQ